MSFHLSLLSPARFLYKEQFDWDMPLRAKSGTTDIKQIKLELPPSFPHPILQLLALLHSGWPRFLIQRPVSVVLAILTQDYSDVNFMLTHGRQKNSESQRGAIKEGEAGLV